MKEAWVDFTAGWASGAMAVLTCQPIDTVLTRYQAGIMAQGVTVEQTRGLVNAFGLQSLWRGSSAMISAVPLQNALLMGGYGMGKQWSEKNKQESNLTSVFVGGTCGGIVQSFLMAPVELMKVNQQITVNKTARQAGEELFSGLFLLGTNSSWRGLNATLLRDGIPHGVWFGSYEWCKNILNNENFGDINEKIAVPLISGAVAAIVAWVVGYPFDIIKTRHQANPCSSNTITKTAIELIHESNGRPVYAFYRGFGLKLLRAIPASMIGFTTYEVVADHIRNQ